MRVIRILLLGAFSLWAVSASAGLAVGHVFPELTLEDQHGNSHSVSNSDQLVILAFDMDTSEPFSDFLSQQAGSFLADHKARYIADISGMPGLIARLFALPAMRDYPYILMLNRDDDFGSRFDSQEGKLTVYRLKEGVVESIDFVDGPEASALFRVQ